MVQLCTDVSDQYMCLPIRTPLGNWSEFTMPSRVRGETLSCSQTDTLVISRGKVWGVMCSPVEGRTRVGRGFYPLASGAGLTLYQSKKAIYQVIQKVSHRYSAHQQPLGTCPDPHTKETRYPVRPSQVRNARSAYLR